MGSSESQPEMKEEKDEEKQPNQSGGILSSSTSTSQTNSKTISATSKISNSAEASLYSTHLSFGSLMSRSSFSCLTTQCIISRLNAERTKTILFDHDKEIEAIWVVSRGLNYKQDSILQHWCIKIHAPPILVSIDFMQSNNNKKEGIFGCDINIGSEVELNDFLHYYYRDSKNNLHKRKWKIISSLTPMPNKKNGYINFIDKNDKQLLKYIQLNYNLNKKYKENKHKINENDIKLINEFKNLKKISINKKISDLTDFLDEWIDENPNYCSLQNNCQKFAFEAYKWLLNDKYNKKWLQCQSQMQSICDIQKYKQEIKKYSINDDINK